MHMVVLSRAAQLNATCTSFDTSRPLSAREKQILKYQVVKESTHCKLLVDAYPKLGVVMLDAYLKMDVVMLLMQPQTYFIRLDL